MSRYFGSFDDLESVRSAFEPDAGDLFPSDEEVLFAAYGGGSYDGTALVIWRHGGKLYEASGNHCSCYGLEGQWSPEETSLEALRIRQLESYDYDQDAIAAFAALVAGEAA